MWCANVPTIRTPGVPGAGLHARAAHAAQRAWLLPSGQLNRGGRPAHGETRRVGCRSATPENPDAPPAAMSVEKARELLGVSPSASFEDVLSAKNKMLANKQAGMDQDTAREIEVAYDTLFMLSMKKRMTGELNVSTSVKYADVPASPKKKGGSTSKQAFGELPKKGSVGGGNGGGGGLSGGGLSGGLSVSAPSSTQQAQVQTAVFVGLASWALAQALLEPAESQAQDVAGLQLGLAMAYAGYCFKEGKSLPLGRAAGLTVALFFAGAVTGGLLENWLRLDIVPIGNFSSPGVFVTECAITALALGAYFLA